MPAKPSHSRNILLPALLMLCQMPLREASAIVTGQAADLVIGRRFDPENSFDTPSGIAVSPSTKKVFIADAVRHRVLRYNSMAAITTGASPEAVLGQKTLTSMEPGDGPHGMFSPGRMACDAGGRLWVCDRANHRVLRFDNADFASSGATASGWLGDGTQPASATAIGWPAGLAADKAGNLYVSDSLHHRVLRFHQAATLPDGAAASGVFGQATFTASAPAGAGPARFSSPQGLAIQGDGTAASPARLYIADSENYRIIRIDQPHLKSNGVTASAVIGQAGYVTVESFPWWAGNLARPCAVAVDSAGSLYIACHAERRVLRMDNAASKFGEVPADGVLGGYLDGPWMQDHGEERQFVPADIAVAGIQRLWVADERSNRVLHFENPSAAQPAAPATSVIGDTKMNYSGKNRFSTSAVAVDPVSGKVFVGDSRNRRVLRYAAGTMLTAHATPEAVLGQPDFDSSLAGDTMETMHSPYGLAFDHTGRLWVADGYNHRVLRFDNAAEKTSGAPADGFLGSKGYPPSPFKMQWPDGLATGPDGRLWVADSGYNRILRFDNAAAKPDGGAADGVLGQPGFSTGDPALTASGLRNPSSVFEDSAGRLWVADQSNRRVLGFSNAATAPDGSAATLVLGQPDFTTGGSATPDIPYPVAVTAGVSGRVYVSYPTAHMVAWYDQPGRGGPARTVASGWLGAPDRGVAADRFNTPGNLTLDANGSLYVCDRGNARILRFLDSPLELVQSEITPGSSPSFTLTFSSVPGQLYDVWSSIDLKSWIKRQSLTGAAGGRLSTWIAPGDPASASRMFYRVQIP